MEPGVRGALAEILCQESIRVTVPQSESRFSFYAQLQVASQTISGTLGNSSSGHKILTEQHF
jgi:hypothetical protein